MWEKLSEPWKICFEEAWDAYCNGSLPIGAALVDNNNNIISRGRNRINETSAPDKQICFNKLSHAEMNVLLQIDKDRKLHESFTLYTTTEPCVLCFGAIVMSGVRKVIFAARDPLSGGTQLNNSNNTLINERQIEIKQDSKVLGNIQRVIRAEYIMRNLDEDRVSRLLKYESIDYESAIKLGVEMYYNGRLNDARVNNESIQSVVDDITNKLHIFER
jgi:tRNA(adenine34) deaminase